MPWLIRNTTTYDRVRCPKIDSYIHSRMEPTVLPGIYINILARGQPTISDHQKGIRNGVWLSSREAKDMVLSYEHYLKTGGSNDTRAQDIDSYMTAMPKRDRDAAKIDPTFRRYAPSPSAREAARQWIEVISRLYVQTVDRAKTDIPFRRCICEVGWGTNVKLRLDAHSMNRNTTYIYGYLNMWTRCILKTRFPPPQQLTLFRVWANDLQIAQVSEITASMLCSLYTTEGGLNPKEAGASVVAKAKPHSHKY